MHRTPTNYKNIYRELNVNIYLTLTAKKLELKFINLCILFLLVQFFNLN